LFVDNTFGTKETVLFYRICGGILELKGRMVQESLPKKAQKVGDSLVATKRERRWFRSFKRKRNGLPPHF
jgi:hypothetical protein